MRTLKANENFFTMRDGHCFADNKMLTLKWCKKEMMYIKVMKSLRGKSLEKIHYTSANSKKGCIIQSTARLSVGVQKACKGKIVANSDNQITEKADWNPSRSNLIILLVCIGKNNQKT